MKINVGCGKAYKKGYLNIDSYDETVADEVQDATDLRFPDNTAERIEACQLIEHLGFVESVYALCEWFRVLKPIGTLLIETPDLETSFRVFLNAGDREKRDLLIWIYGIGTPGMKHGLCYPSGLLTELLERTGFVDLRKASFYYEKNRPALRITCKKPEACQTSQLIASFRKQLNKEGIVDISDETAALDLESTMDSVIPMVAKYEDPTRIEEKDIEQIIAELAIFSPKVAMCFLQQLKGYRDLHDILRELDQVELPKVLVRVFKGLPVEPGKQKQTFRLVHDMGKEALRKLIHTKDDSVLKSLSKTASETEVDQEENAWFFSQETLRRLSDKLFGQGIREFALNRHDEAIGKFVGSILLFRDNLLAYVNAARLMRASGNAIETERNYSNSLKLLDVFDYGKNSMIRKAIENEKLCKKVIREPLLSLDGIGQSSD
jgi:tetratricopeptide (TPR) repeat protein